MIHIGQLKIPVEKVMAEASKQDLKKGIISAGETAVIKRYIEKKLKIKQSDIKEFTVLKKSVDARKKEQIFFIYQVDFFTENEKRVLSRYKKNDVTIKSEKKENYTAKCEAAAEKDTSEKIVIAGFGPAGLFAAYELALSGYKPLVIERGLDVDSRKKSTNKCICHEDFVHGKTVSENVYRIIWSDCIRICDSVSFVSCNKQNSRKTIEGF